MGRLNHAASRVHTHAAQILSNTTHAHPPPWLGIIQTNPPSEKLTRPVLRRPNKPGAKPPRGRPSRIFQPVNMTYEEDKLRWEYFNDHPWELARPRVVLENDGRDGERWDWSVELDITLNRPRSGGRELARWEEVVRRQAARPVNGEAVVQRQNYLLSHTNMTTAAAYDMARKEFTRLRHSKEVEQRVAREEAMNTGAFFGPGPLEIGMQLENQAYENWREWAKKEILAQQQLQGAQYTGNEAEDAPEIAQPEQEEVQEVSESIPATKGGQEARGGAAVIPAQS